MKDIALVSVLMTSYNREKYIAAAIESVLASSYGDFELIVTDDGSSDRTVAIVREYAEKDPRVRLYINDRNLGDYGNRNRAASYALGKYLKYVDADDYIYPWGLEILVRTMEQFPDAGWGLCSLEQYKARPFPFQLSPKAAYEYNYDGPGLFHKAPLSSIIKKEAFDGVGGFADIRMAGDFEMWHRLAQKYPVVLMPHGMVWYREHEEQEMNSHRKYLAVYESVKARYLMTRDCPLDADRITEIIGVSKKHLRKEVLKGSLKLDMNRIKTALSRLQQYRNASGG